jgi:hypothetical protein
LGDFFKPVDVDVEGRRIIANLDRESDWLAAVA